MIHHREKNMKLRHQLNKKTKTTIKSGNFFGHFSDVLSSKLTKSGLNLKTCVFSYMMIKKHPNQSLKRQKTLYL